MFQFTSTTIINSNIDLASGKALWSKQDSPASFNVKRNLKFLKDCVVAMYKKEASDPVLAHATLDLSDLPAAEGVYRIAMYIRLSGSQNSYYANDMLFKGKPLYIEFTKKKDEKAAEVAKKVEAIAKKYFLMVYENDIVKVSANDTKVEISAIDEYQRFTKMDVEYYNPEAGAFASCCSNIGEFQVVASAKEANDPEYDGKNTITQGVEGFGTYTHLMKDFRLPTAANTRWNKIIVDETPIFGAKYNQYVIEYAVNRGIMGGDAVGELTRSKTIHVFYVNQAVAAEFEQAMSILGEFGGRTGNTLVETNEATAGEALTMATANEKAIAATNEALETKADQADLQALMARVSALENA